MENIDLAKWGKIQIKSIFEASNTGNILARDVEDGSGETPYVTASGYNNGVMAHIDAEVLINLHGKAGTVKPAGRSAARPIGTAQILLRFLQNLAACDTDRHRTGRAGVSDGLSTTVVFGRIGGVRVFVGNFG